ncbi:hypothetical protein TWF730_008638 [Orbilia blumenaviensis]|uniref:Uncharacterized protein n=1 Tax=Orbilia blumenaviensis TaxID=1796055 RepID=A0AAV9V9I3_9PEZI
MRNMTPTPRSWQNPNHQCLVQADTHRPPAFSLAISSTSSSNHRDFHLQSIFNPSCPVFTQNSTAFFTKEVLSPKPFTEANMLTKKFFGAFRRKAKKQEAASLSSPQISIIAPLTVGIIRLGLPQSPDTPKGGSEPGYQESSHSVIIGAYGSLGRGSSLSLPTYGQEDLVSIDLVPVPSFPRSLSTDRLDEDPSHLARHFRYEMLKTRGIRAPTIIVGPTRLRALEAYEKLEERAAEGVNRPLAVNSRTEADNGGWQRGLDGVADVEARTKGKNRKSIPQGMARILHTVKRGIMGLGASGSRKGGPIKEPSEGPITMGPQLWLREGVTLGANPRASSPHLYGRDSDGPKRTVHPREWETELVR